MIVGERLISKKLRVTETVLGTRELSAGGGTARLSKTAEPGCLPRISGSWSWRAGREKKKARMKAEEKKKKKKKRYLAFLTSPQQTPQGLRVSFK